MPEPVDLGQIQGLPAEPDTSPDQLTADAEENAERAAQLRRFHIETQGLTEDIAARRQFAKCAFGLVCAWLAIVAYVILLSGFLAYPFRLWGAFWIGFKLSDGVLIALLCTTTANVLALLVIVFNYLFKAKGGNPSLATSSD